MEAGKVRVTVESARDVDVFEGENALFVLMDGGRVRCVGCRCPAIDAEGAMEMLRCALEACSRLVPAAEKSGKAPGLNRVLGGAMATVAEQFAGDVREGKAFAYRPKDALQKANDDLLAALDQAVRECIEGMRPKEGPKPAGTPQDPLDPRSWKGR